MIRPDMAKFTTTNFIGKGGDVVGGQSDPPPSDEVIQGGDYVTKTLGIAVNIRDLYDSDGKLTNAGKLIQKNIRFERVDNNMTRICGNRIKTDFGSGVYSFEPINRSFSNKVIKKITFEKIEGDFNRPYYIGNHDMKRASIINVNFWGEEDKITKKKPLIKSITVYIEIPETPHMLPPMQPDGTF